MTSSNENGTQSELLKSLLAVCRSSFNLDLPFIPTLNKIEVGEVGECVMTRYGDVGTINHTWSHPISIAYNHNRCTKIFSIYNYGCSGPTLFIPLWYKLTSSKFHEPIIATIYIFSRHHSLSSEKTHNHSPPSFSSFSDEETKNSRL